MKVLASIISFILLLPFGSLAQKDSIANWIFNLEEVMVEADNLWLVDGSLSRRSLKGGMNENISRRMDEVSAFHVRYHAPLLLSVASGFGGQSGHLGLNWEGFNLQNIQNGVVDLSLLPIWQFERADLHLGGSSSNFGSGALSGGVALSNNFSNNKSEINVLLGAGSFGSYKSGLKLKLKNGNVSNTTSFYRESAKNNYSFSHPTINGEITVDNGQSKLNSLVHSTEFDIDEKNTIGIDLWFLEADREIPESLIDIKSESHQADEQMRASLNYSLKNKSSVLSIKTAFIKDYIRYRDQRWGIDSKSESRQLQTRADFNQLLGEFVILKAGVQINQARSRAADYIEGESWQTENRFISYLSSELRINKKIELRTTLTSKKLKENVPTLEPAINVVFRPDDKFEFSIRANKNYKFPTSNDLYWNDPIFNSFGNPKLKTEKSKNLEFNLIYSQDQGKIYSYLRAYINEIDDQIIWLPTDSLGWSPINANRSKGKGVSVGLEYKISQGKIKNTIYLDVHYLSSELFSQNLQKIEKSAKLPYAPNFKTSASYSIEAWDITLKGTGIWVDERFSGQRTIEAYTMINASLEYELSLLNRKMDLGIEAVNILNQQFEIVQDRLVPGRMINFSLQVRILKTKQNALSE